MTAGEVKEFLRLKAKGQPDAVATANVLAMRTLADRLGGASDAEVQKALAFRLRRENPQ